jgi:hypothetical protein
MEGLGTNVATGPEAATYNGRCKEIVGQGTKRRVDQELVYIIGGRTSVPKQMVAFTAHKYLVIPYRFPRTFFPLHLLLTIIQSSQNLMGPIVF